MFLVSSFAIVLQELAIVMTVPSFHNFTVVATGWVFAHRRTVTGMLMAAGQAGERHHSAFHRFFSLARWSLDSLGLAVFRVLEIWLPEGSILVALDDTLASKRGLKVFGAGMHYDQRDNELRVVDQTRGWNLQQGTMLYWNPTAPETQFFFNDRDPATGKVFCVLYDLAAGEQGKRIKEFRFDDTPIGNGGVNQRGGSFAAINYGRLARLRPVTRYREAFDWTMGVRHPDDDGVFVVHVESGQKRLLVSFTQLAAALRPHRPDVDQKSLFINHTLWNRDGDRPGPSCSAIR